MSRKITRSARRLAVGRSAGPVVLQVPGRAQAPELRIGWRILIALGLILFVAAVAYLNRDGYVDDGTGEPVGALDAVYYATVSITTTGYGDVIPVTDEARLSTILLITPARILFLILLVGTTLEVLTEATRERYRERIRRRSLKDHFIVCGYGVKGRGAVRVLLARDADADQIVVIDNRSEATDAARLAGFAAITGSAASTEVLETAGIRQARAVVVAPAADDAAVLITLTARQLNDAVTIVAAAREEENARLLRQSGANSVITSSETAGRLLGIAVDTPRLADVMEEMLATGLGLDLDERPVDRSEEGPLNGLRRDQLVVAVVRDGEMIRFDDPRASRLAAGDRVIYLHSGSPA